MATEDDIKELNLWHDLIVGLQEALKELQQEHGAMCSGLASAGHKRTLDKLLGKMNLHANPTAHWYSTSWYRWGGNKNCGFCAICYGGRGRGRLSGRKLQSKPEQEQLSPRPDFDLDNYLNYTKMTGELATRYTWQSVLMFDIEDNYLNYNKISSKLATRYTWQSVLMFDIEDKYLNYTKMIGELATCYTWQSVLMFDTEYRQHTS